MIKVWHVSEEFMNRTGSAFGFGQTPTFPVDYEHVANVDTDNAERAFELTNHIHGAWWENEGVEKIGATERRSTSVRDVLETKDGVFRCEMAGWKKISETNGGTHESDMPSKSKAQ